MSQPNRYQGAPAVQELIGRVCTHFGDTFFSNRDGVGLTTVIYHRLRELTDEVRASSNHIANAINNLADAVRVSKCNCK